MDLELVIESVRALASLGAYYVLVGILLSLPVAIPRVRAALSLNKSARIGAGAVLGVSSLAVSSILFSLLVAGVEFYLGDTVMYYSSLAPLDTHQKEILASGDEIVQEFWLRDIVPPPLQRECISRKPTICQYANELEVGRPGRVGRSWGSYLGNHSMSSIAFFSTILTVLGLTTEKLRGRLPDGAG